MQVILLENVTNLGQLGETVNVKPGYARNFLLPNNKALRATKANIAYFDAQRKHLEAENDKRKAEAQKQADIIDGADVVVIRSASETGHLFGSVSARDIVNSLNESKNTQATRNQVQLNHAIKELGLYDITLELHGEVTATVTLNVARSEDEAKFQKERGSALVSEDNPQAADAPLAEIVEEQAEEAPAETEAEEEAA